eukprot:TRINITY_DN3673_c0_g1_i2.p1 TRINITY_DN3673_c0_g1~~TRINITY_DN3673_c0_g1_i2.p1  ORF type:complete len:975 (+),score=173.46 TRINITY_DN3673_c0_g1_i2:123-2927(+)
MDHSEMRQQPQDFHSHSHQDYEQMVLSSNKEGMDFLRKGQFKQAFDQLKYAEAAVLANQAEDEPTNLLSVTCNNLGCYYKKVGKMHAALSYLRKALKIEVSLQSDDVTVAGTHLNVCAILSKLDKHEKAVQHANCALELISARVAALGDKASQDEYSVLAIAYHNVAVERDYMHQMEEAAAAYQQGHQVAKKCLGEQHPLTQTLGKNADAARQKSNQQASKASLASNALATDRAGSRHRKTAPGATQNTNSSSTPPLLPEIAGVSSGRQQEPASEWERPWGDAPQRGAQLPPLQNSPSYSQFAMPGMQSMNGMPAPLPARPYMQQQGYDSFAEPPATTKGPSFLETMGSSVPPAAPASPPPLVMTHRSRTKEAEISTPRARPAKDKSGALAFPASPGPQEASRDASRGRPPRAPRDPGAASTAATARAKRDMARKGVQAPAAPYGSVPIPPQSQLLRKSAAEKIQRFWRSHHKSRVDGTDRSRRENVAATMIQARWRAFRVRRRRMNKACIAIQRRVRGWLVRLAMKRHKAAVMIQRHTKGVLVRRRLREAAEAASAIQRTQRAKKAKEEVRARREAVAKASSIIRSRIHTWTCRRVLDELRAEHEEQLQRLKAATRIQSVYRGGVSRHTVVEIKAENRKQFRQVHAAIKLQAVVRRRAAEKTVQVLRQRRLRTMNAAVTFMRKMWLGYLHRKRFLELRQEFARHEDSVIIMQRYVRGYLVRLRMWRNAIRAEEELWAAVEIQRCWRGHLGRLRWELEYEAVWSRESAAFAIQRLVRGWLARTQVQRKRKRLARADFEKARRRFKAAQKIQAIVRGVQCRKRMRAWRGRKVKAATDIQRVWRGHCLRCQNWDRDYLRKIVRIQAASRTFLVRCRRFHLLAKVIMIEHNWRRWVRYLPEAEKQRRRVVRKERLQAARAIQATYRSRSQQQGQQAP